MPAMRSSSGPVEPTSSTSPSPTSHSVPSGNTERKVATIDSQVVVADVVGVRPLAQDAAGRQAGLRALEELLREERRDAGHPRVRRLRDDDVVRAARRASGACGRRRRSAGCAGSASASWFSVSKKREASTTSGEISRTSPRSSGCVSAEPSVTPLPRPRIGRPLRGPDAAAAARAPAAAASACRRRSRHRPCRRWPARSCRPAFATATVPVAPSRYDSSSPAASAVARSGPRSAAGVLVGAAREQQSDSTGACQPRRPARRPRGRSQRVGRAPRDRDDRENHERRHGDDGRHRAEVVVQANAGNEDEAGDQRAGDRADGVHGVDQPEVA